MIIKETLYYDPAGEDRTVHIYLPDNYNTSTDRYPVMYFFDGHNLFNDSDATYGKSWGLKEFLDKWSKPMIVVGLECSHAGDHRLDEYCPYDAALMGKHLHGEGRETMDWIVGTLKPYIDGKYRTYAFREATGIGGSSMGGLMALFGVLRYNDIFSRAACLSPSLWVSPRKVHRMCQEAHPAEHTLVYMDYGTEEIGNHPDTYEALLRTCRDLLQRSVDLTFRIDPYGTHSEASWAQRVPFFMRCLGLE